MSTAHEVLLRREAVMRMNYPHHVAAMREILKLEAAISQKLADRMAFVFFDARWSGVVADCIGQDGSRADEQR